MIRFRYLINAKSIKINLNIRIIKLKAMKINQKLGDEPSFYSEDKYKFRQYYTIYADLKIKILYIWCAMFAIV